jgi:ATP/maltotriose-dependent transcriptional regulator MalT
MHRVVELGGRGSESGPHAAQIGVPAVTGGPLTFDWMAAGRDALGRGEWELARSCLEEAVTADASAEAIEALAMAAWWLDDAHATIESRERAYQLFRERGDAVGAARIATWLAWDYLAFRGEPAVANGWMRRARRLLDAEEPTAEHGWLAIREAEFAFLVDNDVATAHRLATEARSVASTVRDGDLEISALALEGLTLASEGHVTEGIRLLDEASAAAVAGEMSQLWAVGRACCYVITACERVRDLDRATQWSEHMLEFAERWRIPHLFAVCRAHYAGVLVWRGTWSEAEAEFDAAIQTLTHRRPGMGFEAIVRLAELRRRQGRLDEATTLFRQVEFHPYAQLGLAAVALDAGDPGLARDLADRFLRQLGPEDRLQRADGLVLLVRALVEMSQPGLAQESMTELRGLVAAVGTAPLRAAALTAEAAVAVAKGDLDAACRCYEDAVDAYQRIGAPFETAWARLELARELAAVGRPTAAAAQARLAHEAMGAMHAEREAGRAATLLHELEPATPAGPAGGLSLREVEVLRLVAQGLSNAAIASELVVSEHTVHRHVANIRVKLGLPSRAAAAAWGVRHGLV